MPLITTVVLSFAAALGIGAPAFRFVFGYAGEPTDLPLFVFVFLVALGIDYNVFLSTRIREEARCWSPRSSWTREDGSAGHEADSAAREA
ncbi:MMPL family protein [Streptomyces sp. 840.1]|nr:MMPL family protein [Streptomyces sp. 840.1]